MSAERPNNGKQDSGDPSAAIAPAPRRSHLRWFALGYAAFLLYGSLVPLELRPMTFGEALERFRQIELTRISNYLRSDWVVNILVAVPLGFLMMAGVAADRRRRFGPVAAVLVFPACMLASIGVEWAQVFFHHRTPSANDIAAQWLGAAVGVALWLAYGQAVVRWLRRVWAASRVSGAAGLLIPGYVVFLIFIHVMPLDLTVRPVEVYHKWKAGRILLVPFQADYGTVFWCVQKNLWNIGFFLPLGALWALVPRPPEAPARRVLRVLGLGLGVAALVELPQLFVLSRYFDATDILTGAFGVLLGWSVVWAAGRTGHGRTTAIHGAQPAWATGAGRSWPLLPVLGLVVWVAMLGAAYWQPFDFVFDPGTVARRLDGIRFVPFADYIWSSPYTAFVQMTRKMLAFVPLGALLALCSPTPGKCLAGPIVLLGVLVVAAVLEAGQLLVPSKHPGITDVLVELLGGWFGFLLARRARAMLVTRSEYNDERTARPLQR